MRLYVHKRHFRDKNDVIFDGINMKKNDIIEGDIISYGLGGEGVIKTDGYAVFVPFAIKGERVKARVLKCGKNIAFAKIEQIVTPSKKRVLPPCGAFKKCGGCSLLHMEYSEQLFYKSDLIKNALEKIGFIDIELPEVKKSEPMLGYRGKLALPVRAGENGEVKIGFFAPNSHRVVETDSCVLHGDWAEKVISALKTYMREFKISAYDENSKKGCVRHIVVKKSGDEFLVILVSQSEKLNGLEFFDRLLFEKLGSHSLYLNINKQDNNVILGEKFILKSGGGRITGKWRGIEYEIGPQSFMQVNEYVKDRIYGDALGFLKDNQTVIDAYCGAGLLTCAMAKKSKKAIGIEIVEEATVIARELARKNGINNAEFICAPCENALPPLIEKLDCLGEKSVLYLDPPRKGVDRAVIKAVLKARPDEIVYISCNPQTLARDAGLILGTLSFSGNEIKKAVDKAVKTQIDSTVFPSGYTLSYVCGYDMFSACSGVETLCVFKRR